ncbi:hypothetical protein DQ04_06651010 [Trypanosoma grayi]|uniref:hypothetical protein n=1 Tax=Trypanosoma grayi TaxID=71804 RepID=UPI0004F44AD5|nr:hypothetical protein DQ04_06651010 [Trypanosoma grayi]KEG08680.1 hypothetical protein DQ04_06651010 [Trypanosoma grayi]
MRKQLAQAHQQLRQIRVKIEEAHQTKENSSAMENITALPFPSQNVMQKMPSKQFFSTAPGGQRMNIASATVLDAVPYKGGGAEYRPNMGGAEYRISDGKRGA